MEVLDEIFFAVHAVQDGIVFRLRRTQSSHV